MSLLLTGGTGLLGRYLLGALLDRGEHVFALVRGKDLDHAQARLEKALGFLGPVDARRLKEQVRIALCDLGAEGLGLRPQDRADILASCDRILHVGASVRFDLSIEAARAVNVESVRSLVALARARPGGPMRLNHVSTAYVAGNRTDVVREDELAHGAGHRNSYEQSKYEAEQLLWDLWGELPITILRPSVIIGDTRSGRTPSFDNLYWVARFYALGLWRIFPATPTVPLDLIPVDVVAEAILAITKRTDSLGRAYHVAAGVDGTLTLAQLVQIAEQVFHRPPVRFISPQWWMRWVAPVLRHSPFGFLRRVDKAGALFVRYCMQNPLFDNTRLRGVLSEAGLALPPIQDVLRRTLQYGVATGWGRKPDHPAYW